MRTGFNKPEWHAAIAALVAASDERDVAAALLAVIDQVVSHDGSSLLVFHSDAAPEVLHHTLTAEDERHYLERYLAGPYLLDPLYELALRPQTPPMCRFRDATPDRFHSSEYYRRYCERTHLKDEMDFFGDAGDGSALVLVVGRNEKRFSRAELARLRLVQPVISAALQRIGKQVAERGASDDAEQDIHQRLKECFENFGEDLLTQREREITHLLLRGHSSKSVARELDIAPGTVMVHKRNLFSKLGITSQYELFSRFIEDLSSR